MTRMPRVLYCTVHTVLDHECSYTFSSKKDQHDDPAVRKYIYIYIFYILFWSLFPGFLSSVCAIVLVPVVLSESAFLTKYE